jgi:hypothetical protein
LLLLAWLSRALPAAGNLSLVAVVVVSIALLASAVVLTAWDTIAGD